jgi:ABC-type oligopeptide transport system ATPase subunit
MMEIHDIITTVVSANSKGDKLPEAVKRNVVISVIDNSGSTACGFMNRKSILNKEMELYSEDILNNTNDAHYMYSFASNFINHGKINVMKEENFVELPPLRATDTTCTAKPLLDIITKINIVRPNIVRVYTDGQTTSQRDELIRVADNFKKNNIKFELIAVSDTATNMEIVATNEESRIPGMDLINMLGNSISSLKIYNKHHNAVPYIGVVNSSINKNCIKFVNVEIDMPVIKFITEFINELDKNSAEMTWGDNSINLKKMLTEIGKLWSLLMVEFSDEHPFIIAISLKLQTAINDPLFTRERIINFIKYGFECVKQNKPIVMTNFENRVKESAVKQGEFTDAVGALAAHGTALNAIKLITMPNKNGVCVIARRTSLNLKKDNGTNVTTDKFNNAYFGIDSSDQAIRIGLRNYAGTIGFPNPRGSASVVFLTMNQMALLYINGIELDCDYMNELRKIAIAQTSMEAMISKGKYDGVGFYLNWKNGNLLPMHYSNPKTHTSLYSDKMINPLCLPETIWWALMMSMLNIYDEQLSNYEAAVASLGIEPTKKNFLDYIKNTYKDQVTGKTITEKIGDTQKSIFTLDEFESTDQIFSLKNHKGPTGIDCNANTWYSTEEIDIFLKPQGCVWCQYRVNNADFEIVNNINPNKIIENLSTVQCKPVRLLNENTNIAAISNTLDNLNISDAVVKKNKFRINLIGITGSGKTTTAGKIKNIIEAKGGKVCIASADKWSITGLKGRELANRIKNEIVTFDKLKFDGIKVIIMDLCNENGVAKNAFGFDFSEYKELTFYPNMNKTMFKEYEAWCLNNVISRPLHNKNSSYWLNPVSAGLSTCIKVHNGKANKIKQMVGGQSNNDFLEKDNENAIHLKIDDLATRYKDYLKTQNQDDDINKFLTEKLPAENK